MALHKFSDFIQAHINAGCFEIRPKKWMGGRAWIWTKGTTGVVGGFCKTQAEAEEAAVAWYGSIPHD